MPSKRLLLLVGALCAIVAPTSASATPARVIAPVATLHQVAPLNLALAPTLESAYGAGLAIGAGDHLPQRSPADDLKECKQLWDKSWLAKIGKSKLIKYGFMLGCLIAKGWTEESVPD